MAGDKAAAVAGREWRRALALHADEVLRTSLLGHDTAALHLLPDQGGPVVEIQGPDGEWRRYFVRLTEVRQ